ncbi:MAG: cytochrome ubiquinol oxidase subunit I [Myxococcales bacterium]|nr:cytochrome ubiquinol oxidase subunit I [Myxococcales bacterium]
MAMSLAFHMVFATAGIGLPLLMVIAEGLWLRTTDGIWLELAKRWAKGAAILFAVGAVSGTVLSFELGLLWPRFMEQVGPVIGLPFTLEGFAFFFEAICLGVYLYGWDRVSRTAHLMAGVGVLVSGALSGAFVVTANAWMNTPAGFRVAADGTLVDIDPWAAMANPSSFGQVLHMTVAAFLATAWLVAGIHAWMLRSDRTNGFHRRGLALALVVAGLATMAQPLTGHVVGHAVAHYQPVKLAALEAHWDTQQRAPFVIGGWPDEEAEVTHYGLEIPGLLSWLAYGDVEAEVVGLSDIPPEDRPPVAVTHLAYQIMLGTAGGMAVTTVVGGVLALRRRGLPDQPRFLALVMATAPLGIVGIEAGWTATEVGRQPWVVTGFMRTAEAVTPVPHLTVPFLLFSGLYLLLGVVTAVLLRRQFLSSPDA